LTPARRLCYNRSWPCKEALCGPTEDPAMDGPHPKEVRTLIRWLKEGPSGAIPIIHLARSDFGLGSTDQLSLGSLQVVTWEDAGDRDAIDRLVRWHESAFTVFAVPVPVTASGARQWLVEQVLEAPERVLFWIKDVRGQAVGHIGLSRFDFALRTVALRDVVCGAPGSESLAAEGVETLRGWVREAFGMWTVDAGQLLAAA
jgi:hypothetical protein